MFIIINKDVIITFSQKDKSHYFEHNDGIDDYKIHCFNGEAKVILVCSDRFKDEGMKEDFFDIYWNHLDVKRPRKDNSIDIIKKPQQLEKIIELSEMLSKDILF